MKRLITFMRPYIPMMVLSLILSCGSVVSTVLIPVLSGRGVDCIVGVGDVDFGRLRTIAFMMLLTIAGGALCQWLMGLVNNRI